MHDNDAFRFTEEERELLAKTADALTAYSGKPVFAETGIAENGMEWVAFGIPLAPEEEADEETMHIQMGGEQAQWLGSRGGVEDDPHALYDCVFLWAIQISDEEGARFVKLDQEGDVADVSDDLAELLPFGFTEAELPDDDEEDDYDEDDDALPPGVTLH
ncbi:MAG: hypothetical protein KER_01485 [Kerstersia gyiorum]|uniref:hypothetical protein n=1 Tax=Kerstersia gyiorum TaxID=206506 RepID=UPI0030D26D2D